MGGNGGKTDHLQKKEKEKKDGVLRRACFNLGSASPCMAVIGWASMLDCRPVYSRLDGYR